MADHGSQITAARRYRRRLASGNDYFAGRRGACKVALLKSRDVADHGAEIWNLVLSEAPATKPASAATAQGDPALRKSHSASAARCDYQVPPADAEPALNKTKPADVEIPF